MYSLLEMLSIHDGANLSRTVARPVRSHDFDFRFARVNSEIYRRTNVRIAFPLNYVKKKDGMEKSGEENVMYN